MSKKYFFFLLLISSCSINNNIIKSKVKSQKTDNLESVSLNGTINLINEEASLSLSLSIKIKKDSLVWFSIRAPFGIELYRGQVSNDSILFVDRTNKTYIKKSSINEDLYFLKDLKASIITQYITANFTQKYLELNQLDYEINEKKNIIHLSLPDQFKISYLKYSKTQELYFPAETHIRGRSLLGFQEIRLFYKDIKLNSKEKIVFKIPKGYVSLQ
tara:strand:- start:141 stop:788 length:648 start_codon:yes stop_codon:yes gene_type:complete